VNFKIIPKQVDIKKSQNIFCKEINSKMHFHEIVDSICPEYEGQIGEFFEFSRSNAMHSIDWLEYSEIDVMLIKVIKDYLVITFWAYNGQAGSLGIYDKTHHEWIFSHSDEGFLVTEFGIDFIGDAFYGRYFWDIPMVDASGYGRFKIHKNHKNIWKISEEILYSRSPYLDKQEYGFQKKSKEEFYDIGAVNNPEKIYFDAHVEKFGKEPVFLGFITSERVIEQIKESIKNNKPVDDYEDLTPDQKRDYDNGVLLIE